MNPNDRETVSVVEATSNIKSVLVRGENIQNPTFTVTKGQPAYFYTLPGEWQRKNGDTWEYHDSSEKFIPGTWRYVVEIFIDNDDDYNDGTTGYTHKLAEQITVKVDGENWTAEKSSIGNYYSYAYVYSKEYVIAEELKVSYTTHVQNIGWQEYVSNGEMSGTSGKSYRLEGIKIKLENAPVNGGITYSTHVQNIGWQEWKKDNEMSGTSGKSLRLEAIKIKLTGEMANKYDVYYRVHAQEFGWLDWAKNGAEAGTAGYSYRLEGIQIKLVEKGKSAPGATARPYIQSPVRVVYTTHVQNEGWQKEVRDGVTSGTVGKGLRLEGIKMNLENMGLSGLTGGISYRTHIQNIGWQDWKENNAMSGTSGKSLRLEAIQIKLTGKVAEQYDVYYRVQAQNFGWLGWAKNGASAGTAGFGYRLESIQIKLVKKGAQAPGSTENAFKSK